MSAVRKFWQHPDTGEEVLLPALWVICWRCDGVGGHDAWEGGMTADEIDEQDPEFLDDYLSGHYDVTCTECGGPGKLLEYDMDRIHPSIRAEIEAEEYAIAELASIERMERRMGA